MDTLRLDPKMLINVGRPKVGEQRPSEVAVEATIDLSLLGPRSQAARFQWDNLRTHDVIFLLTIASPTHIGDKPPTRVDSDAFREAYGIVSVRGAEIYEFEDEKGKVWLDGIDRAPEGNVRRLRCRMDTNQYHLDTQAADGAPSPYQTFNMILRRKPKENNFKAVLETIRDLMNTKCVIPDWLHDLFLGYGAPDSAHYKGGMAANYTSLHDFVDTFTSLDHVRRAFPNRKVIISESWKAQQAQHNAKQIELFERLKQQVAAKAEAEDPAQLDFVWTVGEWGSDANSGGVAPQPKPPVQEAGEGSKSAAHEEKEAPKEAPPPGEDATKVKKEIGMEVEEDDDDEMEVESKPTFSAVVAPKEPPKAATAHLVDLDNPPPPYKLHIPLAEDLPVTVIPYTRPLARPYPDRVFKQNVIDFTPTQAEAIRSGLNPGLTLIVGPPGTGKTDVAVQILSNLYHNSAAERTLIVTHSNQALNQIFEKIVELDIDERHLLRLGHGEELLETRKDFTKWGRVDYMLRRRLDLLQDLERLAVAMGVPPAVAQSCEAGEHFYRNHVLARWERFQADCRAHADDAAFVAREFPFTAFFADAPQPLFTGLSLREDLETAHYCFQHIRHLFDEVQECRPFELLRSTHDRTQYLLTKQARIIAMTCTHAALKARSTQTGGRRELAEEGFRFDNLVMEESGQVLEIETFIPMLLQTHLQDEGCRLKRVVLLGDHHQLPPVVQNMGLARYAHLDQSMFERFVRLSVPSVVLDRQGRARPSIAALYRWRYRDFGDLPIVHGPQFQVANAGFAHEVQMVDVGDFRGVGESEPVPYFYQNLAEAEYVVLTFMYMRLLGYPASRISILTTYNGQKALIRDLVQARCMSDPALFGEPAKISTVDKFQGSQNDYILLSLVRTKRPGHLRDIRRLVVAVSRARLGLYVFCRCAMWTSLYELSGAFDVLTQHPATLQLVPTEHFGPDFARKPGEAPAAVETVASLEELGRLVESMRQRRLAEGSGPVPGLQAAPLALPVQPSPMQPSPADTTQGHRAPRQPHVPHPYPYRPPATAPQ